MRDDNRTEVWCETPQAGNDTANPFTAFRPDTPFSDEEAAESEEDPREKSNDVNTQQEIAVFIDLSQDDPADLDNLHFQLEDVAPQRQLVAKGTVKTEAESTLNPDQEAKIDATAKRPMSTSTSAPRKISNSQPIPVIRRTRTSTSKSPSTPNPVTPSSPETARKKSRDEGSLKFYQLGLKKMQQGVLENSGSEADSQDESSQSPRY